MPYTCGILFANERIVVAQKEEKKESYIKIIMENEYGEQTLAFDEYLLGVLAAVIPGGYEKETIKAQCVIIRSACYRLLYQSAESRFEKNAILRQEHLNLPYLTYKERKKIWDDNSLNWEEKFTQAIKETDGLVIYYKDEVMDMPYFRLSNGMTREVGTLSYIRAVPCKRDLLSAEYLAVKKIKTDDFYRILELKKEESNRSILIKKDVNNYVKQVVVGESIFSGEEFRNLFSLRSSSYSIKREKDEMVMKTKGVGHGVGFCQYAANQLILEGNDFMFALQYFFQNINIQKIV